MREIPRRTLLGMTALDQLRPGCTSRLAAPHGSTTMQATNTRPIPVSDHRSTALTPRGAVVLAILRAQDPVRELDAANREYPATS